MLKHVLTQSQTAEKILTRGGEGQVLVVETTRFLLNQPHWDDSVIESPCPDVCGSAPSGAIFF